MDRRFGAMRSERPGRRKGVVSEEGDNRGDGLDGDLGLVALAVEHRRGGDAESLGRVVLCESEFASARSDMRADS